MPECVHRSDRTIGLAKAGEAYAITGLMVGCMPSFGHCAIAGTGDPSVLISLPTRDLLALTAGEVLAICRA